MFDLIDEQHVSGSHDTPSLWYILPISDYFLLTAERKSHLQHYQEHNKKQVYDVALDRQKHKTYTVATRTVCDTTLACHTHLELCQ